MTETSSRPATIRDVARAAGVSVGAVSKVLNDGYGVSTGMRDKVSQAANALGYRPRPAARAMRGRSYTVGVLLADIGAPSVPVIVEGIERAFEGGPLQTLLSARGLDPLRQRQAIEGLVDRQMDGLILIAPGVPAAFLEELGRALPVVVVARHGGGRSYDTVADDDALGAAMMVDHLVALGHRRIAHVADPPRGLRRPSVLPATVRADGYTAAMADHGLESQVITTSYTEEGGYKAAMRVLTGGDRPTAVFAGADIAALGVLRAAGELGLRVPDDLTVTGSDNLAFTAAPQIGLTTTDSAGRLTGETSARLLEERLQGRETPVKFSLTPRLVVRTSSAPPRGGPGEG